MHYEKDIEVHIRRVRHKIYVGTGGNAKSLKGALANVPDGAIMVDFEETETGEFLIFQEELDME